MDVAPTKIKCEFLKSGLSVVAVFLWSNRAVIRINMHQEATRPPKWPFGGGVKVETNKFSFPNFLLEKNLFKDLAELKQKTYRVNIDMN